VLGDGDCHVWRVDLDQVAAQGGGDPARSPLNAEERGRVARFVFERHRRWFTASHTALRSVLGAYLGLEAAAVSIVAPPHVRPVLDAAMGASSARRSRVALDFNLSHSDGLAVIAVARRAPLGVDVELLRPMNDALALAERHFVGDEVACVAAAAGRRSRDRAFFTCWTRKEAVLKSTGAGLSVAPSLGARWGRRRRRGAGVRRPGGCGGSAAGVIRGARDALGACAVARGVGLAGMFDYVG
jgi:4'-phosphopantetheinyl transferase